MGAMSTHARSRLTARRPGGRGATWLVALLVYTAIAWLPACTGIDAPAGAQCTPDTACPTGLVCIRGLCRAGAAPCQQSEQCTTGEAPVCDDTARVCRACQSNSECAQRNPSTPLCANNGACTIQDCTRDSECPDSTPVCESASCIACEPGEDGDAACAARNPDRPYCTEAGGCGVCADNEQCTTANPVCDTRSGECRPCRDHAECDSGVCYTGNGECADPANVLYVDAAAGSDGGDCTIDAPCETIGAAVARAAGVRRFVRVRPSVYREALSISDKEVTLISDGTTLQTGSEQEGIPVLAVGANAQVTLEGFRVQRARGGSNADGIRCAGAGASLRLVDSSVVDNEGFGVEVSQCTLTIERAVVTGNRGGGISVLDAAFSITGSLIADNGRTLDAFVGGIRIENNNPRMPQVLAFNTVVHNLVQNGAQASGVRCNTATATIASSNIVYHGQGNAPAVSGSCAWAYSDVEGGVPGDGNIDEDPLFVSILDGDYHLAEESPCRDAGEADSAPARDLDGDPRPWGNGPEMGADELTDG